MFLPTEARGNTGENSAALRKKTLTKIGISFLHAKEEFSVAAFAARVLGGN